MEERIIQLLEQILAELKQLNGRAESSKETIEARQKEATKMMNSLMDLIPKAGGQNG